MRGAVFDRYGPPDVFEVRDLEPPPLRGPHDVRIAVHASSINPIDWKIRAGLQREGAERRVAVHRRRAHMPLDALGPEHLQRCEL